MIIQRPTLQEDLQSAKWLLVYGRRKTGKTFLVSEFMDYDSFYFVKRDRTIITKDDWRTIDQGTLLELVRRDLSDDKTVVIDEFHRLGKEILDVIHSMDIRGRLVLISSTLHLSKELVSSSSRILGKVSEVRVDLISYLDILSCVKGKGKDFYELQAFRTEPLVLALDYKNPVDMVRGSILTVPALIGEIFSEEDRKMSGIYEGILRAIAVGKKRSGQISSYIFSRKLIKKDDPSIIQQYIVNLMDLGILKRTKVWSKKRYVYEHVSPLFKVFFALDERYNISDRDLSRKQLRTLIDEMIPHVMEEILRKAVSEATGTISLVDQSPDDEIDGIFLKFKKPVIAMEVKWKDRIRGNEAEKIKERLMAHDVERRILVVPDKKIVTIKGVEILEPVDILDMRS